MGKLFLFGNEYIVQTAIYGERELKKAEFALSSEDGWTAVFCQREPIDFRSESCGYLPSLYAWIFNREQYQLNTIQRTIERFSFRLVPMSDFNQSLNKFRGYRQVRTNEVLVIEPSEYAGALAVSNVPEELNLIQPSDRCFSHLELANPMTFRCFNELYARVTKKVPEFVASLILPYDVQDERIVSVGKIKTNGRPNERSENHFSFSVPATLEFHYGVLHLWRSLIVAFSRAVREFSFNTTYIFDDFEDEEGFLKKYGIQTHLPAVEWSANGILACQAGGTK